MVTQPRKLLRWLLGRRPAIGQRQGGRGQPVQSQAHAACGRLPQSARQNRQVHGEAGAAVPQPPGGAALHRHHHRRGTSLASFVNVLCS